MTMTNAEWMIKHGYKFSNLFVRRLSNEERNKFVVRYNNEKIDYFELNECHISFNDSAYKKWLDMEHKDPILDDTEREYLSAFIKPFRNDVTMIRKDKDMACNTTRFRIAIYVSKSGYSYLPWFNSWTMYKGMDLCKAYTLEELGL